VYGRPVYAAVVRAVPACAVLALGTSLACGARTGLETPPPPDANLDVFRAPDATFDGGRDAFVPDGCTPRPEICDGRDDDCDGVADDGVPCWTLDGASIEIVPTELCSAEWYAYGMPAEASANPPVAGVRAAGRVTVVPIEMPARCGGGAIAVIADEVEDGSGGRLAASFAFSRSEGGILVGDEPDECAYDAAALRGSCRWRWNPCCTDGVMLGPFAAEQCVTFTIDGHDGAAPEGVSTLVVVDGRGVATDRAFGETLRLCRTFVPERG